MSEILFSNESVLICANLLLLFLLKSHRRNWNDSGRAVSRILSAPKNRGREPFVSAADTRNLFRVAERERAAPGFLFGLAPDGVFRALSITRQAVSSYLTFSPLPRPCGRGGLIFCGTVRRNALAFLPRVSLASYAASRPPVFGLSSPGP